MKIFISGVCGFAGSIIAERLLQSVPGLELCGMDNLMRPGSERNRRFPGVSVYHGDIRVTSDLESLPKVDWVIDAAANPSVLAGLDAQSGSRQLVEHNLYGTINLLELCKRNGAGLVLLSTSRVYSIDALMSLQLESRDARFVTVGDYPGLSHQGITEDFSTAAPVSLYGGTKLASEVMANEYGSIFQFPVFVNRCGVLAGAGQFGTAAQGIFSYWIHAWRSGQPLRYIGFNGRGHQVRDAFHPEDLADLVVSQISRGRPSGLWNIGGGLANSLSLLELSNWCSNRLGSRKVEEDLRPRPFDLPWVVLDSSKAKRDWGWEPSHPIHSILEEIAVHAGSNPNWLTLTTH